jgi:hypothetical protein
MSRPTFALLTLMGSVLSPCVAPCVAQTRGGSRPAPATTSAAHPIANLSQVMKGILYPSSNVIFAAQSVNPADVKPAADPAVATNPLASAYGKWQAVENASLAIAEATNLLTIVGRKCSNGLDVPLKNADWAKLVQGLRDASMKVYKAAQAKSQDDIVVTAGDLTEACDNCHSKYREKPSIADRCK